MRVRRRDLHEGDVGADAPVRRQMRDLGERDRHILGLPAMHHRALVGADEEAAMAIGGSALDPERLQARGQEIEELDVGRSGLAALKRLDQRIGSGASGADKDAVARLDDLDRRRGRCQPISDPLER